MTKRVLTGFCFVVVILGCIALGAIPSFALIAACMFISIHEVYKAVRNSGLEPVRWAGYLFCVMTVAAQGLGFFFPQLNAANLSMTALVFSVLLAMIRLVSHGKIAVDSLMGTLFPMLYPGIFFMVLMEITHISDRAAFTAAMVICFFSASVNDAFALFTGLLCGRHKLAPVLSPKKTIEGAVGGVFFCTLFSWFIPDLVGLFFGWDSACMATLANLPPAWSFALLGLCCAVMSIVGDLAASMVKRHCGVKDFGHLLPGHGGIMDRMDGILFGCAFCYVFFEIVGFI